jgi:hypothetical protein
METNNETKPEYTIFDVVEALCVHRKSTLDTWDYPELVYGDSRGWVRIFSASQVEFTEEGERVHQIAKAANWPSRPVPVEQVAALALMGAIGPSGYPVAAMVADRTSFPNSLEGGAKRIHRLLLAVESSYVTMDLPEGLLVTVYEEPVNR